MRLRLRDAVPTHASPHHRAPISPLATALRHARTVLLGLTTAAASYAAMAAAGPSFSATTTAAAVSPVDRVYAEHDCSAVARPERPLLLINTPAGGAELITAASDPDGRGEQAAFLRDRSADWYGWCRP